MARRAPDDAVILAILVQPGAQMVRSTRTELARRETRSDAMRWRRQSFRVKRSFPQVISMDMLVNLHAQHLAELGRRIDAGSALIRPALPPELHIIQDWVRDNFQRLLGVRGHGRHGAPTAELPCRNARWRPGRIRLLRHHGTWVFSARPASAKRTGAKASGLALLYHAMMAMKSQGYAYAVIGAVGPADFYTSGRRRRPHPRQRKHLSGPVARSQGIGEPITCRPPRHWPCS